MTVQYLSEKIFLNEIEATGQVWVARSIYKNIYAEEFDQTGLSLPVWSTRERADNYLKNARLIGPKYEPEAVPLDVFTQAWLSNKAMGIAEVQLNPDGKATRILCYTAEEFQSSQQAN
jgi:hypothetical protein